MTQTGRPELSLIMPCYDEEDVIPYTIPQLVTAFQRSGTVLELVAVDNGSSDRTGEIIKAFEAQGIGVVHHRVEPNEGYGNGVLRTIPVCRAPWIGLIPADGQVDAEDVARLFDVVKNAKGLVLGKVRRRFRMDGPLRKVVSVAYNLLVFTLWPGLGSIDVNGNPKIIHRDVLAAMDCRERQWFLDPEILIKARHLGVRVIEMNVFARMRSNGLSHIRGSTCLEFLRKLLAYRFGGALNEWKRDQRVIAVRAGAPGVTAR